MSNRKWLVAMVLGVVLLVAAIVGFVYAGQVNAQLGQMGMGHLNVDEALDALNEIARWTGESVSSQLSGTDALTLSLITHRTILLIAGFVLAGLGTVMFIKERT